MTDKKPKSLVGPLRVRKMTKAPKPTKVGKKDEKPKLFRLSTGTPSELGEAHEYATTEAAKTAAIDFFQGHLSWCQRFNKPGAHAIDRAVDEVQTMPELLRIARTVTCLLDEHTNFRIAVKLWRVDPPKLKGA